MPPAWFPFGSTILLMIITWYPIFWLFGQVDGWGDLARHYRHTGPLPDAQHCAGVKVGATAFNFFNHWSKGCARPEGLYLMMHRLLQPGHPPVCIPWTAIHRAVRQKTWGRDRVQLFVFVGMNTESVPITLPAHLLESVYDYLPPIQAGTVSLVIAWLMIVLHIALFLLGIFWAWGVWLGGFFM
jgi:hypothetical protein